jgi:hypothetical protein
MAQAATRGHTVATTGTDKSVGFPRDTSALGLASALQEVARETSDDSSIMARRTKALAGGVLAGRWDGPICSSPADRSR